MIESIKASSDCLSLRLPFDLSWALGGWGGWGWMVFISLCFLLKKWRSVLYKCDYIHWFANTKWWLIYRNHYECKKIKKIIKVGWHDCISAVFWSVRTHNSLGGVLVCVYVCMCVLWDLLYPTLPSITWSISTGTPVSPPTAKPRALVPSLRKQPDMSHIHFAPQCGPLCSWSSGSSGSVNNRVNFRETERRATLSFTLGPSFSNLPSSGLFSIIHISSPPPPPPAVPGSKK